MCTCTTLNRCSSLELLVSKQHEFSMPVPFWQPVTASLSVSTLASVFLLLLYLVLLSVMGPTCSLWHTVICKAS